MGRLGVVGFLVLGFEKKGFWGGICAFGLSLDFRW